MKRLLTIAILLEVLLIAAPFSYAAALTVTIQHPGHELLDHFKIYGDGEALCSSPDNQPDIRTINCPTTKTRRELYMMEYTATAVGIDGHESDPSAVKEAIIDWQSDPLAVPTIQGVSIQ